MVYKSGQIFLPFCHNSRVWQTDRRTDRILITIPRLHSMQHGKNYTAHRLLVRNAQFPQAALRRYLWSIV